MAAVRQLNPVDILFVAGENDKVYHHTAGLVILDTSHNPRFDFQHFRDRCIKRLELVPHFRWKLHEVPLGLDLPYWVEDENFRWENHFKRIAVPSPGDRAALADVAAHLYSRHLDRSKPLWEMWYIEGLAGDKVAIMQKTHHCMMDGQGMQKIGELLSDFSPRGRKTPTVGTDIAGARPGDAPDLSQLALGTARTWANFPVATARNLLRLFGPHLKKRLGGSDAEIAHTSQHNVPATFFNDRISADRGFVFATLPLAHIKQVKDAFDVTVNDVILALVSSTLCSYMAARGQLPDNPLYASMAVSLRSDGDDGVGNKVTGISVPLATQESDPLARLRAINAATLPAKDEARHGGVGVMEIMQALPPILLHSMVNSLNPQQAAATVGANLVVSNVRGSPKPMYIAGARLECMYPISILTTGMGLNITCVSYDDGVDFGFTLAPELFDDPWELADGLGAALDGYLARIPARKARARPKKTAAKGKQSAKARARSRKKTKPKRT